MQGGDSNRLNVLCLWSLESNSEDRHTLIIRKVDDRRSTCISLPYNYYHYCYRNIFFFFPEKLILFLKHSIFLQLSFTNAGVHKLYQNVVLMRTMRPVVMEITVRKEMNGYTHSCTL